MPHGGVVRSADFRRRVRGGALQVGRSRLRDYLCGTGKVLMICALAAEPENTSETLGSLRFAEKVGKVTTSNPKPARAGMKTRVSAPRRSLSMGPSSKPSGESAGTR